MPKIGESMLAVDMSNFTDPLTEQSVQGLKNAGVEHVIVQSIDPPAGYPVGRTREQIQACQAGGLTVDVYVWLWFDLGMSDIQHKLALIDGLNVRQLWLDVEDTAAVKYVQQATEDKVSAALTLCDNFPTTGGDVTGIYTGRWFWADPRYMVNTQAFSERKLWDANYDGVADTKAGFIPYGGWEDQPAIKQHIGTSSVAGISGLDQDVLSAAEGELLRPVTVEPIDPRDKRIADLQLALADVTAANGEIRMALVNSARLPSLKANRQSLQAIALRLEAINAQFLSA